MNENRQKWKRVEKNELNQNLGIIVHFFQIDKIRMDEV